MKFTLSWLKEHLDTTASLDEVTATLTRIGLEVEGVEDPAKSLAAFTSAYVVEAVQHPNADKLRVCKVDTGSEVIQVVCGAPNARTGMKAVFAPVGSTIPGTGLVLKAGEIRGQASNGMLVSEREMGLSQAHEGIIELPADAPVGVPFAGLLGVDDPVIEIAVTPNRADALGLAGIARDLAAAGLGEVRTPAVEPVRGSFPSPVKVTVEAPDLCPGFALRLVRGVKNGPSPDWLQKRLRSIGLRPINALVDVTNYLTYDRGRPLHVFDAAKVKGNLVVRRARDGETLLALDGRVYGLDSDICVIADEDGPESLAGIMGGEHSGSSEATTDVLIESALWNELNIARTGRRLGINSDARYRFERGVDPAFMLPGLDLATKLILEICGGEASDAEVPLGPPETGKIIDFPYSEVKRLTGLELPQAEIKVALISLGFWVSGTGDEVKVAVPSWRADVEGKADLVEEVMRIVGVDRVPSTPLPSLGVTRPTLSLLQRRTRAAKRALAARGLVEAVTWSFVSKGEAETFGGGAAALALANPIAENLSDMRPSLLPGLLAASQRNADRGRGDLALFEVGQVFKGDGENDQKIAATAIRRGTARPAGSGRHWSAREVAVEALDAKADVLALLNALGVATRNLQMVAGGPAWFHPGRSATLQFGPQNVIGHFGELHPKVLANLSVEGPLVGFEILLDAVPAPKAKPTKTKPALELIDLQPVKRDFAFVVASGVRAGEVVRAAEAADRKLIEAVNVFDVYEGTGIAPGSKSIAIEVTLQPKEKTLTDAEIEALAAKIVAGVTKATGGVLRG